jgi:hypothetical protein
VLDYVAKKAEAFARIGLTNHAIIVPLIIQGLQPYISTDIRKLPPGMQPTTVEGLTGYLQKLANAYKDYRRARAGGKGTLALAAASQAQELGRDESDKDEKKERVALAQQQKKKKVETDSAEKLAKLVREAIEKTRTSSREDWLAGIQCWHCRHFGHMVKNCPEGGQGGTQRQSRRPRQSQQKRNIEKGERPDRKPRKKPRKEQEDAEMSQSEQGNEEPAVDTHTPPRRSKAPACTEEEGEGESPTP